MPEPQTDRNVYILGAGFSADANAPLLYNFLDRSRELLDDPGSGLDDQEREEFRTVFQFRRKVAQSREKVKIDLDNIEQLFGLVEMEQRLGRSELDTRRATTYVIAKTLELMISRSNRHDVLVSHNSQFPNGERLFQEYGLTLNTGYSPPKASVDLYDLFAMLIGGKFDHPEKRLYRKDVVITFNYDLVLDHAFMRAGIPFYYHLPSANVIVPGANRIEGLSFLKLHGSTNWAVCTSCKQKIFVSLDKMTASPGIFKSIECPKCQKRVFQPMLVPPSWDKTEYQSLIQPVWKQAVTEVQKATRICIIGYSLPESDAYFKYLLTLGLSENHGLYKFIVVDLAPQLVMLSRGSKEPVTKGKTLQARYDELLEDVFRERRFLFHNDGLYGWLMNGRALADLGRGELITLR